MADYTKEVSNKLNIKLREEIKELPSFANAFFRGITNNTSIKTRIAYAMDLKIFFEYLIENHPLFTHLKDIKDISLSDLDNVKAVDLEDFTEYLSYYTKEHYKNENSKVQLSNSNRGKMRKLSTLRSFYKYYFKKEMIKTNPTVLVDLPKNYEKPIIRLEPNEVANLLDEIESGKSLTPAQLKYHNKTKVRDLAIVTLLVGTGIRISECVGLNVNDVDFNNDSFVVTRKGGNKTILYMPEEVREALLRYLRETRENIDTEESALFLSLQNKRMTQSSIQKMLKKYTKIVVPLKNISPHKLRSTYGTNLYKETGDIYLVADVLGHKDVNTTKKHYAAIEEERRKIAARVTKLRDD
ncbi:site-specific recombinase, phage integrase family [Anaerofustis stercorihominis DSM 17244]|uniref:Site-specific recombinase, phage integrase family n=1 Tax=Anaerofustis stercorihominis DSM 17244 TaxID=445971 RepID=B1C7V1_9FIRM|nr:tyrosine-type recombinase/integrase [Anaerofustis stercorihominis]EDS73088.1 site-specific recombinase, phage integrase family [Anaerofustis stercorihominis DSM 17244]